MSLLRTFNRHVGVNVFAKGRSNELHFKAYNPFKLHRGKCLNPSLQLQPPLSSCNGKNKQQKAERAVTAAG